MTTLRARRTKLSFETAGEIRERGRYRPVVVEAEPDFAVFRLKGTQHRLRVSWDGLYAFAARCAADQVKREKAAAKAAAKKGHAK